MICEERSGRGRLDPPPQTNGGKNGGSRGREQEWRLANTAGACSVCELAVGGAEGEDDFCLQCANCRQEFHTTCSYAPEVLAEYPVRRRQAEGVWICGKCVDGVEPRARNRLPGVG